MQSDDLGLARLLRSRIGVEFDGEAHLTEAEAQSVAAAIERLEANEKELRRIISECAAALPNGAFISPEASIEFMANLAAEIKACFERLVAERDEARRDVKIEHALFLVEAEKHSEWLENYMRMKARADKFSAALIEISSPTQTEKLLWWQTRARQALGDT